MVRIHTRKSEMKYKEKKEKSDYFFVQENKKQKKGEYKEKRGEKSDEYIIK